MPRGSGWFNQSVYDSKVLEFHKGINQTVGPGVYVAEDFIWGSGAFASWVPKMWTATETGTGTSHALFVCGTGENGTAVGVAGATSANAQELAMTNVMWKPSTMGPISIVARAKAVGTTTAADGDFFVGWADVVTGTSGLGYDISLTSTVTATGLTEGAVVGYSSIPTSGALHPASGNNYYGYFSTLSTVAATPVVNPQLKKKDSNYHIYKVTISTAGDASFFLDGQIIGSVAAAVTSTTALTPYFDAIGRNSHANTATIDYVVVSAAQRP